MKQEEEGERKECVHVHMYTCIIFAFSSPLSKRSTFGTVGGSMMQKIGLGHLYQNGKNGSAPKENVFHHPRA